MVTPSVMVVLPTLGSRLDTLAIALDSCGRLRELLHVTVCVVAPSGATEARELATHHGAQIVEDPGTGMAGAINEALHTSISLEMARRSLIEHVSCKHISFLWGVICGVSFNSLGSRFLICGRLPDNCLSGFFLFHGVHLHGLCALCMTSRSGM